MSTDIAVSDTTAIALAEPAQFGNHAIDQLLEYAKVMDVAYDFASKLSRTVLAGPNYRGKPEDATAAILYGAELGLNPIQSLQQIFTVHGTPAIYARTMVALLKVKGYRIRTDASSDESVTVSGVAPNGETETSTWTIDRALRAGYVPTIDEQTGNYKLNSNGKLDGNMKYLTDPQAMLYAKAAAEVCRKLAPDVLLGIAYTSEDLESEPQPVRVQSERVSASSGEPVKIGDILNIPESESPAAADEAPVRDDESVAAATAATEDRAPEPEAPQPEPTATAPVDDPAADPITPMQLKKLHTMLSQVGLGGNTAKNREEALAYINNIIDRAEPITSTKQLTMTEAARVFVEIEEAGLPA
ncbi:hypothetical protein JGU71_28365 [Antrihabitans sp. YC3-6]|uniref:SsDNA binding protein n=1 Tax=Antrihabitans stalagmiti TaxID=2799499 RepID=A0A934U6R9_9NOCA|nr:hypothetical protein [Antrihabitans stalagmiti]MBJ8342811.1 hypothetical protein [Antrihabitans stalagmiti]